MTTHEAGKRVHESYIRAGGRAFISAFYDRLMDANDEIKAKFERVDMETQTDNLARAIVMSFLFVDQSHQTAARTMEKVRESHSKNNLDIPPQLYDAWLDCLIDTVAELDPQADEELLEDWRSVMQVSINHIRGGY